MVRIRSKSRSCTACATELLRALSTKVVPDSCYVVGGRSKLRQRRAWYCRPVYWPTSLGQLVSVQLSHSGQVTVGQRWAGKCSHGRLIYLT